MTRVDLAALNPANRGLVNAGSLSQLCDRHADQLSRFAKRRGGNLDHDPTMNAEMHLIKSYSCSYAQNGRSGKQPFMQERQRINATWMADVMDRYGLTAKAWAERACEVAAAKGMPAQINGTTITRAMKDDYKYVTKATTLELLAAAVGETAPETAEEPKLDRPIPVPTVEVLRAMIATHYRDLVGTAPSEEMVSDLSARMHDSLASLQDDPDAARVPEAARSAALQIGKRLAR